MASKEEQIELGRLVLQSEMKVKYIKDVQIREKSNEHGRMILRFIPKEEIKSTDTMRYQGISIQLATADGETVFCGTCVAVNLIKETEYTEVEVIAKTLSIVTDKEKKSLTFQGTEKTIGAVLSVGIGTYGLLQLESDFSVSEMLSQENETDWIFGRRIANQYQKQLFVNSKTTGCQIHMGNLPFQQKEIGMVLHSAVGRDIDKVRKLQGNISPEASAFEYETTTLEVSDLTIGVGYGVSWQGRKQIVVKSKITCVQGLLQNEITLSNEEGLQPPAEQSAGNTSRSSILTGTVLEVEGTNIKVEFPSRNDTPRWIPYANTANNYFYCMPDVGDTVFVYYETGDSSKIVCLGSRHVRQSPDFDRYQDKMLTADNRMIQFGDKTVNLVGNRKEYDGEGGEQAKIIFNDELGMEIQSTKDIVFETEGNGVIEIQAVKDDFAGMEALRQKFTAMYTTGDIQYKATGGVSKGNALESLNGSICRRTEQSVKENLKKPEQVMTDVEELAGRIGGAEGTEAHAEESPTLDEGKAEVIAGKKLVAEVGSTSLSIGEGILEIKTNTYLELGTDRSVIQAPAIPEASPEESVVVEEEAEKWIVNPF